MKNKYTLTLCICTVMLCGILLGGCSSKSTTTSSIDEATTTTVQTEPEAASTTETHNTPEESETPSQTESTDNTQNSNDKRPDSTETNKDENPTNSNSDSTATCTISLADGTEITAKKGDIITYTYYLKTPKEVECVQATLNYTPNFLKLLEDDTKTMLPVISSGAIINYDNSGVIKYNAINLSGYNFKTEAKLITVRFEVMFSGSAAITNAIEFMDEKGGAAYVDNYKFEDDVKHRETLTLK